MKNNSLIQYENSILRIFENTGSKALVIDCGKRSMPKWVDTDLLTSYFPCADTKLFFVVSSSENTDLLLKPQSNHYG